jgi:four helix bundle protein
VSENGSKRIASFRDLVVWQRAIELVDLVYRCSARWPAQETYGLSAQIRRAAVSVPANIAEGQGRNGRKEFVHHLGVARGSLFEVETMVEIAERQGFVSPAESDSISACIRDVGRLLNGLLRSLDGDRNSSSRSN